MAALGGFCNLRNLRSAAVVATLPCILIALYPAAATAQDTGALIPCYQYDGHVSPNNTRCPNSNTCCNARATCLSNRLCHNEGDDPDVFVRGPCAVRPKFLGDWDDGCAQICKYNEFAGIFPRVIVCSDGSLCCNRVDDCCNKGRQFTFLDESGNVVASKATAPTTRYVPIDGSLERSTVVPSARASTSSTATAESTSSPAPSSPAPAETSPTSDTPGPRPPASGSDDSLALKVGLGLGIPLAVLLTACAAYFLRRRQPTPTADNATYQPDGSYYNPAASMPGMVYAGVPKPHEPKYQGPYPAELGDHRPAELGVADGGPQTSQR